MKLRILSYNIHKGFTIGNRDFILEQIRLALRETNADVLFLQEVLGDHQDKKCKIPDWKTAIQFEYIADQVWSHFAYGKNAVYPEGHHGNAILSKFPIVEWQNYSISTNRFEQRGLLKTKVMIPQLEKEILLCNTHLDLFTRGDILKNLFTYIKQQEISVVWVTHDLHEAFRFSDEIGVLNFGKFEQVATPIELVRSPHNLFVAQYIGYKNFFHVKCSETSCRSPFGTLSYQWHQGEDALLVVPDPAWKFSKEGISLLVEKTVPSIQTLQYELTWGERTIIWERPSQAEVLKEGTKIVLSPVLEECFLIRL